MKKLMILAVMLSMGTAMAEQITFDPTSREGQQAAYAALGRASAANNAARLEKNLDRLGQNDAKIKAIAAQLKPELDQLQAALK